MDILVVLMIGNIVWTGLTNLLVGVVAVLVAVMAWWGQKKLFSELDKAIEDVKRQVTAPETIEAIVDATIKALGPVLENNAHEVGDAVVAMSEAVGKSVMQRMDGKIGDVTKKLQSAGVTGGGADPMAVIMSKKLTLPEKALGLFVSMGDTGPPASVEAANGAEVIPPPGVGK